MYKIIRKVNVLLQVSCYERKANDVKSGTKETQPTGQPWKAMVK